MTNVNIVAHMLGNMENLYQRDYLIDLFGIVEWESLPKAKDGYYELEMFIDPYIGKLVSIDGSIHQVIEYKLIGPNMYHVKTQDLNVSVPSDKIALCKWTDEIEIPSSIIINYKGGGDTLVTTIGNVIINYMYFIAPFGDVVPYRNDIFSNSKVNETVANLIITKQVTPKQLDQYARNAFFIGTLTQLSSPVFSEKMITVDPKIIKRKEELVKKYAKEIEANDPITMANIEAELIGMLKDYLKGDPSMRYLSNSGKSINVQLKRLYLTIGMVEQFGNKSNFTFIPNSLEEGWDYKHFHELCNDSRKGSQERAMETANGGVLSKFLMRVFQNSRIVERDCGTTDTITVHMSKDMLTKLEYRYIIDNGKLVQLTPDVISSYLNKNINLRTTMHCKSEGGFCYTCIGEMFATLDQNILTMRFNRFGREVLIANMKAMHGISFSTVTVDDIDKFIIPL